MDDRKMDETTSLPWKFYLTLTAESLLTFYLATFCVGMFIMHHGTNWVTPAIVMAALYLFVIFACGKRIITKLPLPALMIVVPIAPFLALTSVVSLIPVLEKLK